MGLPTCPICKSDRVVIIVSPTRRAFCAACGTHWVQEGRRQRTIVPGRVNPAHPSVRGKDSRRP